MMDLKLVWEMDPKAKCPEFVEIESFVPISDHPQHPSSQRGGGHSHRDDSPRTVQIHADQGGDSIETKEEGGQQSKDGVKTHKGRKANENSNSKRQSRSLRGIMGMEKVFELFLKIGV